MHSKYELTQMSHSRNGYEREKAVNAMAEVSEPWVLPELLYRANDWVKPVRERARAILLARVEQYPASHFAPFLPMVAGLRNKKRTDHAGLVRSVEKALLAEPDFVGLRQATRSENRRARRLAYGLLWTQPSVSVDLIERALNDSDVVVRIAAAHYACRGNYNLAPLMLANASRAVRRLGLTELARDTQADLTPYLLDESEGVRADARYFMKKRGMNNFVAFYNERVEHSVGREQYYALLGLGDLGEEQNLKVLKPFLTNPQPRLRRAAVRGMGALTCFGPEAESHLVNALGDSSRSVSLVAFSALSFSAEVKGVSEIFRQTEHLHVRLLAFDLLPKSGRWASIRELVVLASDPLFERRAHAGIRRWLAKSNRSFVEPSKSEIEALHKALIPFRGPKGQKKELLRIVKSWSRDRGS